jgi:acyl-coenzyme A synthetase/AMP-(fatty) acid ligase
VQLLDEVVVDANGSFTLLGRQADLIKIAGRASLARRAQLLLQDLPGLEDGVFYLPPTGNPTERLA